MHMHMHIESSTTGTPSKIKIEQNLHNKHVCVQYALRRVLVIYNINLIFQKNIVDKILLTLYNTLDALFSRIKNYK